MKKINLLLLCIIFTFNLEANVTYENAEDNVTSRWSTSGANSSGVTISNIYDIDNGSQVIKFEGAGLQNGYRLGFPGGWGNPNAWNNQTDRKLKWSMNYSEDYEIYISVQTINGQRSLKYTNSDSDLGNNSGVIHHGLGQNSSNGIWQTFIRDLDADLEEFDSGNSITSVNAFYIKGSGSVDDIMLSSGDTEGPVITSLGQSTVHVNQFGVYNDAGAEAFDNQDGNISGNIVVTNPVDTSVAGTYIVSYNVTDSDDNIANEVNRTVIVDNLESAVYEDAEDNTTIGWSIYDLNQSGVQISNIYDANRGSQVIDLNGSGVKNGYMLGFPGGWGNPNSWNNEEMLNIVWSMNYSEDYVIYISVQTQNGHRLLSYTNSDTNNGISFGTIHHGLGSDTSNGTWQTFTRDLDSDLQEFEPANHIISVNAFQIRGSGRLDDIALLSAFLPY